MSAPPPPEERRRFALTARLRGYLLTGILVTAPLTATAYLTWVVVKFIDSQVLKLTPAAYREVLASTFAVPGVGLVLAIVLLTLIGWLAAGFIGRRFVRISEKAIRHMPLVRGLYSAIKQIFSTMLKANAEAFRHVALVPFPRPGCWSVAFVSSPPPKVLRAALGLKSDDDWVGVFMPTAPNPTSGYLMYMPRSALRLLDLSVEDGLKLVVSGGLAAPEDSPFAPKKRRSAGLKPAPAVVVAHQPQQDAKASSAL